MQPTRQRVYFPKLGHNGRFGNSLFQYAAGLALARKHGCEFEIHPNVFYREHHGQKFLLGNLSIPFVHLPDGDEDAPLFEDPPHNSRGFNTEFHNQPGRVNIHGYYENEQYFDSIRDEIKRIFQVNSHLKAWAKEYLDTIRNKHGPNTTVVGLHIRRGDMLDAIRAIERLDNESWYHRYLQAAMDVFEQETNVVYLVFSGGARTPGCSNTPDIDWCREMLPRVFPNTQFEFAHDNGCIKDFALISSCDHVVLHCASTFGWWAAYLNETIGCRKIVPKTIPGFPFPDTYWSREFIALDIPH
jgi:hypothetical protein